MQLKIISVCMLYFTTGNKSQNILYITKIFRIDTEILVCMSKFYVKEKACCLKCQGKISVSLWHKLAVLYPSVSVYPPYIPNRKKSRTFLCQETVFQIQDKYVTLRPGIEILNLVHPARRACSPDIAKFSFFSFSNRTITKGDMVIFVKQSKNPLFVHCAEICGQTTFYAGG